MPFYSSYWEILPHWRCKHKKTPTTVVWVHSLFYKTVWCKPRLRVSQIPSVLTRQNQAGGSSALHVIPLCQPTKGLGEKAKAKKKKSSRLKETALSEKLPLNLCCCWYFNPSAGLNWLPTRDGDEGKAVNVFLGQPDWSLWLHTHKT